MVVNECEVGEAVDPYGVERFGSSGEVQLAEQDIARS
jgi:hypothetical protein